MSLIKRTEKFSEKPMMPRDYMSRPKRRRMVADKTEAGAVDDNARKRMEDRRKALEEAAG